MSRRSGLAVLPVSDRALRQRRGRIPRHRQASSCHRQRYGQTERHLRRRRLQETAALPLCTPRPGTAFFLDCRNEYTHISSEDDPWELMWIHFTVRSAMPTTTIFSNSRRGIFTSAHLAELTAAIQSVIRFHEEPTDDTDLLTAQQIVNILTLICTETDRTGAEISALGSKLKQILHYLDEHYTETISLIFSPKSSTSASIILRGNLKRVRHHDHTLCAGKITHAKELLRYSNSSIEEIARLCRHG